MFLLRGAGLRSICTDDSRWLFVSTKASVYAWDTVAEQWYRAGDGLPRYPQCSELALFGNRLVMGT
jgi:hypothetical protein